MNKAGPIVVIEDDIDDQTILMDIFERLDYKNEIVYFSDSEKALVYLNQKENKPFIILSDINMPKMNGIELRNKIFTNEEIRKKCIPYLFFTTSANRKSVTDAYAMSVYGFFIKPVTIVGFEKVIGNIIEYWKGCISLNEDA